MWYFIIYIIGVLVTGIHLMWSFRGYKKDNLIENKPKRLNELIGYGFLLSLYSWIGFVVSCTIKNKIYKEIK